MTYGSFIGYLEILNLNPQTEYSARRATFLTLCWCLCVRSSGTQKSAFCNICFINGFEQAWISQNSSLRHVHYFDKLSKDMQLVSFKRLTPPSLQDLRKFHLMFNETSLICTHPMFCSESMNEQRLLLILIWQALIIKVLQGIGITEPLRLSHTYIASKIQYCDFVRLIYI